MLVATVAGNFGQFSLGGRGGHGHDQHRHDEAQSASSASSDYQRLLMNQEYNLQRSQYIIQASTGTQIPSIAATHRHEQTSLYQPHIPITEMTYLGQTLIPHGYPSGNITSSNSPLDNAYANQQLTAWQEQQRQHHQVSPTSQQQTRYFGDYSQGLQAGSRTSLSSSRASIDASAAHSQQYAQIQKAMFSQMPSSQHQSPQSDYMITTLPHHHHTMPSHSPNTLQSSEYGESSSRERDGGAPNMVGQDGMPEPAAKPKGPKLKFTRADDALLVELKESKNLTWKQIADFFPGRSSGTLQVRYCTKLKAKTTVWTDDMVSSYASHNFELLSTRAILCWEEI